MKENNSTDTICALASAPGVAGIAVIRVSGPQSFELIDDIFHSSAKISSASSHTIHFGRLSLTNSMQDEATVAVFRSPRSYTGEDVAEVTCHGGYIIPSMLLDALVAAGARIAEPGEFTKRAFLNGKMDLTQVESVADLIHASSSAGANVAAKQLHGAFRDKVYSIRQSLIDICALLELELDFANEDLELVPKQRILSEIDVALLLCRQYCDSFQSSMILRSGFRVSLVGHPNAGKSLLFNELLEKNRSIVHDVAGTTRDYIQESVLWDGMRVILCDTAGLRETTDIVEAKGVLLSDQQASDSDLILVVNDSSADPSASNYIVSSFEDKYPSKSIFLVQNKSDLLDDASDTAVGIVTSQVSAVKGEFALSAKTGFGIQELRNSIISLMHQSTEASTEALINQRHYDLLRKTEVSLSKAKRAFQDGEFNELVSFEIRQGIECLGLIVGDTFSEEVLQSVFSKFCIGK